MELSLPTTSFTRSLKGLRNEQVIDVFYPLKKPKDQIPTSGPWTWIRGHPFISSEAWIWQTKENEILWNHHCCGRNLGMSRQSSRTYETWDHHPNRILQGLFGLTQIQRWNWSIKENKETHWRKLLSSMPTPRLLNLGIIFRAPTTSNIITKEPIR